MDKAGNSTKKNSGSDIANQLAATVQGADVAHSEIVNRLAASSCSGDMNAYGLLAGDSQFVDYTAIRDAEVAAAWLVINDDKVSLKDRTAAFIWWAELNSIPTNSDEVMLSFVGANVIKVVTGGSILVFKGTANAWPTISQKLCALIKNEDGTFSFRLPGGKAAIPLGPDNLPSLLRAKSLGKGSTGRTAPHGLNEQLAMKQVLSDPLHNANALAMRTPMNDPRWPGSAGWIKMSNIVRVKEKKTLQEVKIDIHFVYNQKTGQFDDFKFKD